MAETIESVISRAATLDELLSEVFDRFPYEKVDPDLAARRLAAWRQAAANGDRELFARRLERDGLSLSDLSRKLGAAHRKPDSGEPAWAVDARWIAATICRGENGEGIVRDTAAQPFEHTLAPVSKHAEELLWSSIKSSWFERITLSARRSLRYQLLSDLCELCAPAFYEQFTYGRAASKAARTWPKRQETSWDALYRDFVSDMRAGGFESVIEKRPVLLRLMAVITRQWIDSSRELLVRLKSDWTIIHEKLLQSNRDCVVAKIEGGLSDPHNNGRSVQLIVFDDESRVVYKPKDLCADAAWFEFVQWLNQFESGIELRAAAVVACSGYGWMEFIEHCGCETTSGLKRFFRRSGAWLALFHIFVTTDMHHENVIAAGDQPVPIDLEMIMQASAHESLSSEPEAQAFNAALEVLGNSVLMVGTLPAYARSGDGEILASGGLISNWQLMSGPVRWTNINTDEMRPEKASPENAVSVNLPHLAGKYAILGDYVDEFVSGFKDYARFLSQISKELLLDEIDVRFGHLRVRKVVRPTHFYYLLLGRLRNPAAMEDGVLWSIQAEFLSRLVDWQKDEDPLWALQKAERRALLDLNIPYFTHSSERTDVGDSFDTNVSIRGTSGTDRAKARLLALDDSEIEWQALIVRQSLEFLPKSAKAASPIDRRADSNAASVLGRDALISEANNIALELEQYAIRRGPGVAWIGLDWLGDSEVCQFMPLGPDLYNGSSGIAIFLAAHAAITGRASSADLALAAVANVRSVLRGWNGPRVARALGVGGATGLGSVVYALTVIAKFLENDGLRRDACNIIGLFSDGIIAADRSLDALSGSAGAILCLLRLFRDTQSDEVLCCATKFGEHLLRQKRVGPEGRRSWRAQGFGSKALNGFSHGAAGFAYALGSLAIVTNRQEFSEAALECIAFENASFSATQRNWPDFRGDQHSAWTCQWCHGGVGIGLSRIAMLKRGFRRVSQADELICDEIESDIVCALDGVQRNWPDHVDTLCCGSLGAIEFIREAGIRLERRDLVEMARQKLLSVLSEAKSRHDYRWNAGARRFNLGLFRGLAGVGYSCLRGADQSLPNVLTWD